MVADRLKRFWDCDDWSHDPSEGLLFSSENKAGRACSGILQRHYHDVPAHRYTAPITIEFRGDSPPDLAELKLWLMSAVKLFVDYQQDGLGGGTAILKIDWRRLDENSEDTVD